MIFLKKTLGEKTSIKNTLSRNIAKNIIKKMVEDSFISTKKIYFLMYEEMDVTLLE